MLHCSNVHRIRMAIRLLEVFGGLHIGFCLSALFSARAIARVGMKRATVEEVEGGRSGEGRREGMDYGEREKDSPIPRILTCNCTTLIILLTTRFSQIQ
jgi:hypothetical protein